MLRVTIEVAPHGTARHAKVLEVLHIENAGQSLSSHDDARDYLVQRPDGTLLGRVRAHRRSHGFLPLVQRALLSLPRTE